MNIEKQDCSSIKCRFNLFSGGKMTEECYLMEIICEEELPKICETFELLGKKGEKEVFYPFFHALCGGFTDYLFKHGSSLGITDHTRFKKTIKYSVLSHEEDVVAFVFKGMIVEARILRGNITYKGLPFPGEFSLIKGIEISSKLREAAEFLVSCFRQYVAEVDFQEIMDKATLLLRGILAEKEINLLPEINELYLVSKSKRKRLQGK